MEKYRFCVVGHTNLDPKYKTVTGEILQFIRDSGPIQCIYRLTDGAVKHAQLSAIRVFETAEEADKLSKAHNRALNKGGA
ncbi:hypothetical protein Pan161_07890 [Gimesia algae]|uniref:Uncharacterized protein n=1 Tax=Gimesia algae TaxID=2527971 RepID=A0A517V836_9PLAN|nr:hypothetical protein Pan161_07890 [Gimesia algae]